MPLVMAQCTNCGGSLEVDNTKEAAVCPFCGQAYIVEKAIQQFNITNTTHIENTFIVESEYEKLHDAGVFFINNKEYDRAIEKYEKIKTDYPYKNVEDAINYIIALSYNYDVNRYLSCARNNNPQLSEIEVITMAIDKFEKDLQWIPSEKRSQEIDRFINELLSAKNIEQNRLINQANQEKKKRLIVDLVAGVFVIIGILIMALGKYMVPWLGGFLIVISVYMGISIHLFLKRKEVDKTLKYKPTKILFSLLLIFPFTLGMALDYGMLILIGIFFGMVGVAVFILAIRDFSNNHPL